MLPINASNSASGIQSQHATTRPQPIKAAPTDRTYETLLQKQLQDSFAIVFVGHSGEGYAQPDLVSNAMAKDIDKLISAKRLHREQVIVVAGGTADGVGQVYAVAKDMGLETLGIVASQGKENKADGCDSLITVDNSNTDDWSTKLPESREEMIVTTLRVANSNLCLGGELFAYSGGRQAYEETLAAARQGYPVNIMTDFDPVDTGREQPFKDPAALNYLHQTIKENSRQS